MTSSLQEQDPSVGHLIGKERARQQREIELIASENIVSSAVLEAMGSVLTNKYAEGYPGRRYYSGCQVVDEVETLARERAQQVFQCRYANVQPHSGSQANQGVFMALMSPGDTFMGLSLDCGGHLTHGSRVNQSGKWFNAVGYPVDPKTHRVDVHQLEVLARKHRPKLIIAGASSYPRFFDFKVFREVADQVGALFMVDMAHFAGLVAAGEHPDPFEYADVVTTTTHKTLRGPRGGMILTNREDIAKAVNGAMFPGLQGGPLMHIIAAKAVAFGEALRPEFKTYGRAVRKNAQVLAHTLLERGLSLITGGTDTHMLLVDLRPKARTGHDVALALEEVGLICNKNAIPFDTTKPTVTSGLRLGSPAVTTRGFGEEEMRQVGHMLADVIDEVPSYEGSVRDRVQALCTRFPLDGM